jgi:two-component system, NtrC family, nitrogen regulation sensor histidine kinase NtrY
MSLRTRLLALVSAVVAITVILVTATVSSSARSSFAELDAQRTAALVAQFRREFALEGQQVGLRLDRIAASDTVVRTAAEISARRDPAAYVNDAAPLATAQGLEFLDLVSSDGKIISSAHWPAKFGYAHPWATAANGSTAEFLQVVELPQEVALGLVAVRRVGTDGALVLAGGRRLDREFLKSLVLPPGMRVLLYRNIEPEISRRHLITATGDTSQEGELEPLIARVRETGAETSETIDWPDGPERLAAIPIDGRDGNVLGVLLVGSSERELAALVRRIRWSGVGFGALGIGLGIGLSYVVASKVTRPVEQLAGVARTVASGDWDVRLDHVRTSGELAALADAFETMTRQLVEHRERLVQAERVAAWRELARRLAHELKNPLFPMRITLDNLNRSAKLPEAEFKEVFDESLTTLSTGLANLNTVIGRFSDFSRMPVPEVSAVSPNAIVTQAVALFRAQLEAPGAPAIRLSVDLDPRAETLRGDEEQLGRALQNLLLNAIDAMPSGGELGVRTRLVDRTVHIEVSDSGQGLTEEERSRLFTPYYTTKQHGTGLGLAIVQSVVADHGGRIRVESVPGRGATFHLELPIGGPASTTAPAGHGEPGAPR